MFLTDEEEKEIAVRHLRIMYIGMFKFMCAPPATSATLVAEPKKKKVYNCGRCKGVNKVGHACQFRIKKVRISIYTYIYIYNNCVH